MEREADEARDKRLSEERRLAQVKEELSELEHEHEQTLNLRSREQEDRLDELQREQQRQMERIEQLKREEEDIARQREVELGQLEMETSALEERSVASRSGLACGRAEAARRAGAARGWRRRTRRGA